MMKKPMTPVLLILAGIVAGILISSAVYTKTGLSVFGEFRDNPAPSSKLENPELTDLAYTILKNIRDGDYEALSHVTHPEFGIVFSPCATITLPTNKCFQSEQIAAFAEDTKLYVWGLYKDGRPIELTAAGYFANFVYDKDYYNAPIIGVNHIVRSGNALENITEIFRDVQFVDFHFPGSEPGPGVDEEHGWSSLRLGFEEYDGRLFLTVILRSHWTA